MTDDGSDEEVGLLQEQAESRAPRAAPSTKARRGLGLLDSCLRAMRKVVTQKNSVTHSAIVFFVISGLLGVLLWDLQQVHRISAIIHDDHSSLWEYMNDTALKQWLTPLDMCLLGANDPTVDLKKFRASNCSQVKSYSSALSPQRLFCSIGSSMGKQCLPPLSQHTFFRQRLHGFNDPYARYLSKALRTLARKQIPLLFIGDGLSKQNEDALVCDLLRTDRVNIAAATNIDYHEIVSDYSIRWKDEALRLDIKYFPLSFIDDHDGEGDETALLPMFRKQKRKRRRIYNLTATNQSLPPPSGKASAPRYGKGSPSLSKKPPKPSETGSNITFFEGASPMRSNAGDQLIDYQLKATDTREASNKSSASSSDLWSRTHTQGLQVVQEVIEAVLAKNHSVAIIANAGLWYNSRERFRKELPVLLGWLDSLAKDPRNIVLYRETAAQHWNHTSYGYYDSDYQHGEDSTGTCVPIADSTPELDWRNSDVRHVLANDDLRHLRVIPFHKYTMPLYNMHPTSPDAEDCTHYCYFPQMWQPVWYALYNSTLLLH